jgi:hypothetical protein
LARAVSVIVDERCDTCGTSNVDGFTMETVGWQAGAVACLFITVILGHSELIVADREFETLAVIR